VHALRDVFAVAGVFALGGLATVVFGVGRSAGAELRDAREAPAEAVGDEVDFGLAALTAEGAPGEGAFAEAALSA
jgi:hypothetical protein